MAALPIVRDGVTSPGTLRLYQHPPGHHHRAGRCAHVDDPEYGIRRRLQRNLPAFG